MDKKLLIPLLLAVSAACTSELEYIPLNVQPQIVMNSLMTVGEEEHSVYLSLSRLDRVEGIQGDAQVQCFVDGSLAATAREVPTDQYQRLFVFKADLHEGDSVRLVATAGEYSASAGVVVPSAPVLEAVDTLPGIDGSLDFRIAMKDNGQGTDYYSIGIFTNIRIEFYNEGVLVATDFYRHRCSLDTSGDLILSEDNIASSNLGDLDLDFGTPNFYGAFLDNQFELGSVVLKPSIGRYEIDAFYYFPPMIPYDEVAVNPMLSVELSHIQPRHYYYLKALNSLESGTTDLALEDVSVPDNVEGGMGFVGISNTAVRNFELPTWNVE